MLMFVAQRPYSPASSAPRGRWFHCALWHSSSKRCRPNLLRRRQAASGVLSQGRSSWLASEYQTCSGGQYPPDAVVNKGCVRSRAPKPCSSRIFLSLADRSIRECLLCPPVTFRQERCHCIDLRPDPSEAPGRHRSTPAPVPREQIPEG